MMVNVPIFVIFVGVDLPKLAPWPSTEDYTLMKDRIVVLFAKKLLLILVHCLDIEKCILEKSHLKLEVCLKKFADRSRGGLKIHKRTHTREMPYQCEICQKRFSQAGPFKYHKETRSKEMYNCDGCRKVFKNSLCLRRHCLHYEKAPFKCNVCNCKSFASLEQIERHKKSHSHLCNCYDAGLLPRKENNES